MTLADRIRDALAAQWRRPSVHSVTLQIPVPPSVNRLWAPKAGGGLRLSPEYSAWRAQAGAALEAQRPGRVEGEYELRIVVPRKTRADLGNLEKAVSDLLQAHGVIENDRLAARITIDRSNVPACLATVESVLNRTAVPLE